MVNKESFKLEDLSYADICASVPEVAVIPFGAVEPHGMHLPFGTDVFEAGLIAERCCRVARERGASVLALPAMPYGVNTNQAAFPMTMSLYPSTLNQVLSDLTESLDRAGVRKCVVFNSHGGNDFSSHLRELHGKRKCFIVQVDWWLACADICKWAFGGGGDHANEMETSVLLYLRPELVDMSKAGPQPTAEWRFQALKEKWARAPRPWERYTQDSGAGDPRGATAEKGKKFVDASVEKIAKFLVELAAAKVDEKFPFA